MRLANVIYIPGFGVNLVSGGKNCDAGLTGQFSKSHVYLKCRKNKIITATMQDGFYVIIHIKHVYQDKVFFR
jgi:hypothetical protein